MDLADIAALLTAGGVGGVVAKWIGDTSLRRTARADLLDALRRAERVFWSKEADERDSAMDEVSRAALIAGTPKVAMDLYRQGGEMFVRFLAQERFADDGYMSHETQGPAFAALRAGHGGAVRVLSIWLWRPITFRLRTLRLVGQTRARYEDAGEFII